MSNRSIAALSFRLAGIYALIEAMEPLQRALYFAFARISPSPGVSDSSVEHAGLAATLVVLVLGIISYLLIFRCDELAVRMFPNAANEPRADPLAFHAFAYSVAGVFLIGSGLPRLGSTIVWMLGENYRWTFADALYRLLNPLLRCVLGASLFFGSHALARFWSQLRHSSLREQGSLCLHCGYNLTGNTTGRCPECGKPFEHPAPPVPPSPQVLLTEQQMRGSDPPAPAGE